MATGQLFIDAPFSLVAGLACLSFVAWSRTDEPDLTVAAVGGLRKPNGMTGWLFGWLAGWLVVYRNNRESMLISCSELI